MRVDYYQLLDVDEKAGAEEIKKAYRRQAMKFHPDRNVGNEAAEERFKLVVEAYRVLSDEARRYDYDGWLERQRRYAHAPELAAMPRRVRVSARHGRERRDERARAARARARRRYTGGFFSMRRPASSKSMMIRVGCYALALCMIFPMLLNRVMVAPAEKKAAAEVSHVQGQTSLSPEEVRMRMNQRNAEILSAALAGDASAQFHYGWNQYHGYNGMQVNREEARQWFEKSAAQGNGQARQMLQQAVFTSESRTDAP